MCLSRLKNANPSLLSLLFHALRKLFQPIYAHTKNSGNQMQGLLNNQTRISLEGKP